MASSGHKWKSAYVDDAADSVDALPAFRKLLLKHPTMVVGPFSPTIEAVINQFKPNNVADFMVGGLTQLDHMNYPYVFRTSSSDSNEAIAMAYYAIQHGLKSASLIFDNSANSQGFVPPLEKAFKTLGGTIDANITITPGQSSYNAELAQAFAKHPQVIFDSMDSQSAATLFSDGQQLGYMNVPWIGDDLQSAPNGDYAKAFGPTASTELTAALPASPSGAAFTPLPQRLPEGVAHEEHPADDVQRVRLGCDRVARDDGRQVDEPEGVGEGHREGVRIRPVRQCSTYAACVRLIKKGKKINYQGASGNDDFNKYHNVFSGFQMLGFDSSLNNVTRAIVTPQQLAVGGRQGGLKRRTLVNGVGGESLATHTLIDQESPSRSALHPSMPVMP